MLLLSCEVGEFNKGTWRRMQRCKLAAEVSVGVFASCVVFAEFLTPGFSPTFSKYVQRHLGD